MPGDDSFPSAQFVSTRSITIDALPADVWPWLAQVGCGRAGFYSNDLLDNLGRPSATTIVADLQHLTIGQWVPMSPSSTPTDKTAFRVDSFEVASWMLWAKPDSTWSWRLTPTSSGGTRLVTRVHAVYDWSHPATAFLGVVLMELGDFAMMRRMLRGIKTRAESVGDPLPIARDRLGAICCRPLGDVVPARTRNRRPTLPLGLRNCKDDSMRAAICTDYGPPEVLVVREVVRPQPRADEVLVQIHASTVNSSDWFIRSGIPNEPAFQRIMMRLMIGVRRPRRQILGLIVAGEVVEVGAAVKRFHVGDRVNAFTKFHLGGYAEYTCLRQTSTVGLAPSGLSFDEAAAITFGGLLALHYLRKGGLKPGMKVLLYGASSGVGTAAVQLAKHLGAEVTVACGSENAELVRSLGADQRAGLHEVGYASSVRALRPGAGHRR
jgi:hypothetical protein